MQERLQKIIARAGVTSRRKAEELISTGRVSVNGKIVTELGEKADSARDSIKIDGKPLKPKEPAQYWLLYKPREVVTTLSDPEGRPSIQEFLRGMRQRLYPVGRLDYHSEGLLLLTNDGELAHKVMHASSHLPKVYWVKVSGRPAEEQLERLRQGVYVDGKRTAPAGIRRLLTAESPSRRRRSSDNPWLEVTLIEGRNQQIRKMFATVDHPVEKLKRVSIGPLKAGNMKPGEMRPLTPAELARLRKELEEGPRAERATAKPSPRAARANALAHPPSRPQFDVEFKEPKRKALDFDVDDDAVHDFDFDRDFNREHERGRESREFKAKRGARPGSPRPSGTRPERPATSKSGPGRAPRTSGRGAHQHSEVRGAHRGSETRSGGAPSRRGPSSATGPGKKNFGPKRPGANSGNRSGNKHSGDNRRGASSSGRRGPQTSNRGAARRSPRGR